MVKRIRGCVAMLCGLLLLQGCAPKNVSFSANVKPILDRNCLECHVPGGAGYAASGFDVSSYDTFMKGGKFGSYIVPGDPSGSNLIVLVEGRAHPSIRMPHGRAKLDDREIEMLKVWVQEGANND